MQKKAKTQTTYKAPSYNKITKAIELEKDTLFGDIRDAILSNIRDLKKPWQQMSEMEQRALNERIAITAKYLINQALNIVSAGGRKTVEAQIESITIKDGVKVTLKCSKKAEQLHELSECQGKLVLLVTNQADDHMGEKTKPKVNKDQPALPLDDEDEENEAA